MSNSDPHTPCDYLFKTVSVGASNVGKTQILLKYVDPSRAFDAYTSTIGVDFEIRTINLDGKIVKLQMWDVAGPERFRTVHRSYFRGAHGVFFVYDITDRGTFENIPDWLEEFDGHSKQPNVVKILLGNKSDLESNRAVSQAEAKAFAAENNLDDFFETSALNGKNVEEAYTALSRSMLGFAIRRPPTGPESRILDPGPSMNTQRNANSSSSSSDTGCSVQ